MIGKKKRTLGSALLCVLLTASPAVWSADAAPYTDVALRKLNRASHSIESPRVTTDDPTARLAALVSYLERVYSAAGFSFEKSFTRYLVDYQRTHVPELHAVAEPLGLVLASMDGARLERVFKGETLRLAMAISGDAKREEDKRQAAVRDAALDQEKESTQAILTLAPLLAGHYVMSARDTANFVDVSWTTGTSISVSAERYLKDQSSSMLCRLPLTDVPMRAYSDELAGDTVIAGCKLEVRLKGGNAWLRLSGSACNDLCAVQGRKRDSWTGDVYRSEAVKQALEERDSDRKANQLTPAQQSLRDELRSRDGERPQTPSRSPAPSPASPDDPNKALKDAVRALDGLLKGR